MGSFKQFINYDVLFAEIDQKQGISEAEKAKIKFICDDELDRRANPIIGKSLGAAVINGFKRFLAFVQNIFTGFKMSDPMASFADAGSATTLKMDAHMRDESTAMMYLRIKQDPTIARFASDITGQYPVTHETEIGSAPAHNLVAQINEAKNIPNGTSSRLSRNVT